MASNPPFAASLFAATGISKAPGTFTRVTLSSVAPCRLRASIAPSTSLELMKSLNLLTTIANLKPSADIIPSSIFGIFVSC